LLGFVCQALNRLMAEAGRGERISTSSGYLRGGGHNPRAFDLVAAPRDLRPGDTMWKEGHIRIVTRVRAAGDGTVEFTTAESSSVGLIGPVAKEWRCPDAARFAGSQVRRKGAWAPNGEANAYSRYKPLAAALGVGATVPALAPAPVPAAKPAPAPAAKPAPATVLLTQAEVDRLARVTFGNAKEINAHFGRTGSAGFAEWFNAKLGGKAPFIRPGKKPSPMTMPVSACGPRCR
jgi:hypothetical protein